MRYLNAAQALCAEIDSDTSGETVRAGLDLALRAWHEFGPAWDRFGLHLLAADEFLRDLPTGVADCEAPDGTERAALTRLLNAVGAWLDGAAADEHRPLAERLGFDAASNQVRRALAVLP
jgi:hypothetical protein